MSPHIAAAGKDVATSMNPFANIRQRWATPEHLVGVATVNIFKRKVVIYKVIR
jgi:hypothetical protein